MKDEAGVQGIPTKDSLDNKVGDLHLVEPELGGDTRLCEKTKTKYEPMKAKRKGKEKFRAGAEGE